MINIFISMLFAVCAFSLFTMSTKIQGLNTLLLNVPLTIFEYSTTDEGTEYPYYIQENLKSTYKKYIEQSIYNYVDNYSLDFRFYFPESGGLCNEHCQGVEVMVKADIVFAYEYERIMFYEVKENIHG